MSRPGVARGRSTAGRPVPGGPAPPVVTRWPREDRAPAAAAAWRRVAPGSRAPAGSPRRPARPREPPSASRTTGTRGRPPRTLATAGRSTGSTASASGPAPRRGAAVGVAASAPARGRPAPAASRRARTHHEQTARRSVEVSGWVTVTLPIHPLYGAGFPLVRRRQAEVELERPNGQRFRLPVTWTDVVGPVVPPTVDGVAVQIGPATLARLALIMRSWMKTAVDDPSVGKAGCATADPEGRGGAIGPVDGTPQPDASEPRGGAGSAGPPGRGRRRRR